MTVTSHQALSLALAEVVAVSITHHAPHKSQINQTRDKRLPGNGRDGNTKLSHDADTQRKSAVGKVSAQQGRTRNSSTQKEFVTASGPV